MDDMQGGEVRELLSGNEEERVKEIKELVDKIPGIKWNRFGMNHLLKLFSNIIESDITCYWELFANEPKFCTTERYKILACDLCNIWTQIGSIRCHIWIRTNDT